MFGIRYFNDLDNMETISLQYISVTAMHSINVVRYIENRSLRSGCGLSINSM